MPTATGYFFKTDAIAVIASITEVTKQHFFFVAVILAFAADFAVGTFPIV